MQKTIFLGVLFTCTSVLYPALSREIQKTPPFAAKSYYEELDDSVAYTQYSPGISHQFSGDQNSNSQRTTSVLPTPIALPDNLSPELNDPDYGIAIFPSTPLILAEKIIAEELLKIRLQKENDLLQSFEQELALQKNLFETEYAKLQRRLRLQKQAENQAYAQAIVMAMQNPDSDQDCQRFAHQLRTNERIGARSTNGEVPASGQYTPSFPVRIVFKD